MLADLCDEKCERKVLGAPSTFSNRDTALFSFRIAVLLSTRAVGTLIGRTICKPFLDRLGVWWILVDLECQLLELLSTPTATRSSPTAFIQLARNFDSVNANVVNDLAP